MLASQSRPISSGPSERRNDIYIGNDVDGIDGDARYSQIRYECEIGIRIKIFITKYSSSIPQIP